MTLLRYVGEEPATVEGHPWSPGEARHVEPTDAARLLALYPKLFRQEGGEAPVTDDAPVSSPWHRAMLAQRGHRAQVRPWR